MTDEKMMEEIKRMTYSLSSDIVSRENSDGSIIIMKMEDGDDFYKVNGIAANVYKSMESNESIENICSAILDKYETNLEVVYKDVSNLLSELKKVGILA